MRFSDLEPLAGRMFSFSVQAWAMALLLGRARERSNHGRAAQADRGVAGNEAVDLLGSLGELLLLRQVMRLEDAATVADYMRHHMYAPGGGAGVKGPDLELEEDGKRRGVDVKTFDCAVNKRYFAINAKKHADLAGCCEAYLGLVAPPFGRRGVISRLVPYDEVSRWPERTLRAGGNPSRNLPIGEFARCHIGRTLDLDVMRSDCHELAEIERAAAGRGPGSARRELAGLLPLLTSILA